MQNIINDNIQNVCFIGIKKVLENGQVAFNIRGSGLLLEGKKVISCAHVYSEIPADFSDSIFVGITQKIADEKIQNYDFYDINLLIKNDVRDIALFTIKDEKDKLSGHGIPRSILMSEKEINNLTPTTTVYFAGFPLANEFMNMGMGVTFLISQCIIGAVKFSSKDKKVDFILVDKHINSGNSGSPVFLEGKIIGLASGTINQTTKIGESLVNVPVGVGIVRTSNYILDLLSDAASKE
jgi:hypothetical protein